MSVLHIQHAKNCIIVIVIICLNVMLISERVSPSKLFPKIEQLARLTGEKKLVVEGISYFRQVCEMSNLLKFNHDLAILKLHSLHCGLLMIEIK